MKASAVIDRKLRRPPLLYDVATVAELLFVSEIAVRRLIWAKELPHLRIGRAIRVPAKAVDEYIESRLQS